jgi:hypothetical protein
LSENQGWIFAEVFHRDEGDKSDAHHRVLGIEDDPMLIFRAFDPAGMGFEPQSRLSQGSSLQAHLQD